MVMLVSIIGHVKRVFIVKWGICMIADILCSRREVEEARLSNLSFEEHSLFNYIFAFLKDPAIHCMCVFVNNIKSKKHNKVTL
mmetsp:Transcript_23440/g.23863  ORF Transcript_23440/g.23863 Transcript_23440/m.23863 type:complete len:83 (+) Transcript_23440:1359-1607(+)